MNHWDIPLGRYATATALCVVPTSNDMTSRSSSATSLGGVDVVITNRPDGPFTLRDKKWSAVRAGTRG